CPGNPSDGSGALASFPWSWLGPGLEHDGDELGPDPPGGQVGTRGRARTGRGSPRTVLHLDLVERRPAAELRQLVGELQEVVVPPADADLQGDLRVELLGAVGAMPDDPDDQTRLGSEHLDVPEHLGRFRLRGQPAAQLLELDLEGLALFLDPPEVGEHRLSVLDLLAEIVALCLELLGLRPDPGDAAEGSDPVVAEVAHAEDEDADQDQLLALGLVHVRRPQSFTLAVTSKAITRVCSTRSAWVTTKSTSEKMPAFRRFSMKSAIWRLLKARPLIRRA